MLDAAAFGHVNVIKLLIDNKADIAVTWVGSTVHAIQWRSKQVNSRCSTMTSLQKVDDPADRAFPIIRRVPTVGFSTCRSARLAPHCADDVFVCRKATLRCIWQLDLVGRQRWRFWHPW